MQTHLNTVIAVAAAVVSTAGSFLAGLDPAWIALIGTLFGGVVLKVTEKWLGKGKAEVDDAKEIREELRSQVLSQRQQVKDLEDEVDEWRSKYYDLRDSYTKVATDLQIALNSIKSQAAEAERRLDHRDQGTGAG